jgi:predicted PurR-regulated permease PerM
MTFLEGHFLTPMIVGRRLALNALAVFIALAFWTWLWGPMGAFLSSPLLIVALIVKEHLMPSDAPQLAGGLADFESGTSLSNGAFVPQMNSIPGSFRCR